MTTNNIDAIDVASNLRTVLSKIDGAVAKRCKDPKVMPQVAPKLVAASKIKPAEFIVRAYEAGQRDFGENYVSEMAEKATHPLVLEKCKDIRWHFIGHLQSNKINKLLSVPGLYMIQTLHSEKLADNLHKQWVKFRGEQEKKLKVLVQINTSAEEAKNGVEPSEATKLVEFVLKNCPYFDFQGLMTIGQYDYDVTQIPNVDFTTLSNCREEVCKKLKLDKNNVELSMGMSADYDQAILQGATIVRVGTCIFGRRPPKYIPNE